MSPERYQQVSEIYHAALEVQPEQRAAFLDEACGADDELRREVESLLAAHDKVGNYFASPALEVAAGLIAAHQSPSLVGQNLSHYRVLSLIGAGGMGEVYLAEDTLLDRKVAIKFLPSELVGDERAKMRLLREAQAAAKLDHPNIRAIHEVAEEDNRNFIVMQYVEGETLARRLHRERLELPEALGVAIQVADALSEAHSRGVIHRDIKPANIVLTTRGQAKVMDFGLAKVITDANQVQSEAITAAFLTEPGAIVGTVPYMSPEQVQGETIDARSDIFSFGAVLYEMVGGHKPFAGKSAAATFSAILSSEPPALARYAPDVPAELERITRKCLEKRRERRYQSMRDVLTDLENLRTEYQSAKLSKDQGLATASVSAAGTNQSVRRPRILTSRIALVGYGVATLFVIGVVVYALRFREAFPTASEIKSLAVLPLDNLSGYPGQDYLADGMTEALITELSKIGSLRVTSRKSVMQYKSALKPLPEIARELNVDVIVSGSVQRSGDRLGITAHLIRGATDQQIWANQYERDFRDVISLQREVARAIAGEINVKLTPKEQGLLANARPINPEAHEAYLHGLFWLNKAIDETREEEVERLHQRSFEYFEQAIKLDPDYAVAYSALASSYHFLAAGGFPKFYPKAKESALKALALDDSLASAHGALAYTLWRHEWNFVEAEKEFKKAEELTPNAYAWGYAQFLSTLGRHDEALRRFRIAQDVDPLTVFLKVSAGHAYFDARQFDRAIAQFRSVLELDPKQFAAHSGLCMAHMLKGMHEEGIAECQRALELSGDKSKRIGLAWAYATAGRRSDAIKILDDLKAQSEGDPERHFSLARIYSALGEKDLAMAQLEIAYVKREDVLWLKVDPTFDGLRADPRLTDLLRRIGFPE